MTTEYAIGPVTEAENLRQELAELREEFAALQLRVVELEDEREESK